MAYDAWGKRRPAATWQTPLPGVFITAAGLHRGFTMHEHLDQVGLIHMGGRVYDPEIGRFVSADPFVQYPASTQGFNRYAYVGNNPLSYTDPSGYFSLKSLVKTAVTVVATVYGGAIIGGAVAGYLSTGTLKGAELGAALGALAGAVAHGVGGAFGNVSYACRRTPHDRVKATPSVAQGCR